MFQPWTVTPPNLGSLAIVTNFISSPPAPPDSTVFLDRYFPYSILPSHHQQPFIFVSLSLFSPAPYAARTRYAPVSAAHLCTPLHVPVSAAISRYCAPPPPLSPSACAQVPVSPLGVCPSQISPSPLCPPSPSLISPPNHRIFWILVSCCVNFRAGVRYQGASTPCQLLALEPPPPCYLNMCAQEEDAGPCGEPE